MDNTAIPAAEQAKVNANYLRGTLSDELETASPEFSKPSIGVLKFHGIYQQDDRDLRKQGKKEFSDMVRVGVPGGVLSPGQYLTLDRLASLGDGSLRITTRQDIQYHYIPKTKLRELIQGLNESYLSTLAACGDVVRNVISCPAPFENAQRQNIQETVNFISKSLKPKTAAYYEIWMDGEKAISANDDSNPTPEEPLYGSTYLPRKFKIGFTYEGDNTIDVYANDIGIVPHFTDGCLTGYTILAGGGMGQSAGVKASHPRLADPICSIGPDPQELLEVCSAIVTIHRDFGNRTNRKLARLKYVLDAWGVDKFKAELEQRVGRSLNAPKPLNWVRSVDYLGWHKQDANHWFVGVRVISGRIRDFDARHQFRSGLRGIVQKYGTEVRLTCQQNLYLSGIKTEDKDAIAAALQGCGLMPHKTLPPILRHAMACPALPTCGQAITESERIMPAVVKEIQAELNAAGLAEQTIDLRTSGCPNGCSRPYTAEIGIVGASVDMYTLYLGASPLGTRMGGVFAQNVKRNQIPSKLRPVIERYKAQREPQEAFGDFCHRIGVENLREMAPATA